jgi:hypothetical protein
MYYARDISVLQKCTLLGPYGAGTWPLHPEHLPPSFSAWVMGTQPTVGGLIMARFAEIHVWEN